MDCHRFIPNGVETMLNYASYIFTSIECTLGSIKMLLKTGKINDAYVLIRKLFKDANEWIKGKHRIPCLKKILQTIKDSPTTKDLYSFFEWDTYLKKDRELLDDSVHSNRYSRMLINCNQLYIENREKYLDNASAILRHIFTVHLSFIFYLNPQYMMDSTYIDYLDEGATPPEGSENWIAVYAQEAFDKYIKNHTKLTTFIKRNCYLQII